MMTARWRHSRVQHARQTRFTEAGSGTSRTSLASGNPQTNRPEHPARYLRLQLEALGPLYSSFGLYLSSRLDLLPADYCRELARTADEAPALEPELVSQTIACELGASCERIFAGFDWVPFRSGLLAQYHRAVLRNGSQVVMAILRPDYYPLQAATPTKVFSSKPFKHLCSQFSVEEATPDFLASLSRSSEFKETAEALKDIAGNNPCPELMACSRVFPELSSRRILTFEYLEGNAPDQSFQNSSASHATVRRLCHTWLATALFCQFAPVNPHLRGTTVSPDQRITFMCSEYVPMPAAAREDLWKYLVSTMTDDPDRSAMYLLRQMRPPEKMVNAQEFRSSFRQSAYFAALEPILGTDSNALAQLIFQHWKTALAHGYTPKPHLLGFYRGLFSIAAMAGRLSRDRDFLQEAMEELRGRQLGEQFQTITDFNRLAQNFDKFAAAIVHFPKILDEALTQVSKNDHSRIHVPSAPARSRNMPLMMVAVMVLIAVLVISQPQGLTRLSEKAVLLLLMLAGLLALRATG